MLVLISNVVVDIDCIGSFSFNCDLLKVFCWIFDELGGNILVFWLFLLGDGVVGVFCGD